MSRLIGHLDIEAVDALPIDSVLFCRVGEVFQVKRIMVSIGPTRNPARAWYAIGYGDRVFSAQEVSEWGPLLVLFNPQTDVPDNVLLCSMCQGTGEDDASDGLRSMGILRGPLACSTCRGRGYFNTDTEEPITLAEAIVLPHARPDVSRETFTVTETPAGLDPATLHLGQWVEAHPRDTAPDSEVLVDEYAHRLRVLAQVISWEGDGPLDRDAVLRVEVNGEDFRLLCRAYRFTLSKEQL